MLEQEMIMQVMEEKNTPLKAKMISKFIFEKFNGYKISKQAVRDILWDKNILKDLIVYDKNDYTYTLQSGIDTLKKLVSNDDCVFKFQISKVSRTKNDNELFSYNVKGDRIEIKHSINDEEFESLLIGLVRSEIENAAKYKKLFRKIKLNIAKAIHDKQ